MSASSTWCAALAPSFRSVSSASSRSACGRKPYEHGQEVRLEDRLQHQLRRHLHHSVSDRRDAQRPLPPICLRDVPAQHRPAAGTRLRAASAPSSSRKRSTPYCSTSAIVSASTPAAPLFRSHPLPRLHRTSLLQMRSYSAWKRLSGDRLAAAHSRRCSCRTLSIGLRPPGLVRSGPAGHALALTCSVDVTTPGTLPSRRVVRRRHHRYYDPLGLPLRSAPISPSAYTVALP